MRLKLNLDEETERKLVVVALREKRPITLQAEWLLVQALAGEDDPGAEPHKDDRTEAVRDE